MTTAKRLPSSATSVVVKAQHSPAAKRKETTGLTDDGLAQLTEPARQPRHTPRIQAATALNEYYVFTLLYPLAVLAAVADNVQPKAARFKDFPAKLYV